MNEEANYLNAGKLVLFSSGEYSDYSFGSCYVATKTVSFDDVQKIADDINEKKKSGERKVGWYEGCAHTEFIMQLIENGWMIEVDITERHIGSYGSLEV